MTSNITKLRTIIVDDEPLALKLLAAKLGKLPNIEIVAQCINGRAAIDEVVKLAPDLLFLDIQMPGLSGLDVVKELQSESMPLLVFATAYDQYALEAFDAHAVDYVLKPIDDARIARAVSRAEQRFLAQSGTATENKTDLINAVVDIEQKLYISGASHGQVAEQSVPVNTLNDPNTGEAKNRKVVIKDRDEIHLLKQQDIQWIDAAGDYVCVHALGQTYVKRCTLKEMLEELDNGLFKRVHRSTIVNLNFIDKVIPHTKGEFFLMMGEFDKIKVSRNYKDVVKQFLIT